MALVGLAVERCLLEAALVVRMARVALDPGLVVRDRAGVALGQRGCWRVRWTFRYRALIRAL